jgi:hypothetical protein
VARPRGLDLGLQEAWLKGRLAGLPTQRHHLGVDEEATKIIMTTLADIREDVRRIREEIVEDDGEEEAEDFG